MALVFKNGEGMRKVSIIFSSCCIDSITSGASCGTELMSKGEIFCHPHLLETWDYY